MQLVQGDNMQVETPRTPKAERLPRRLESHKRDGDEAAKQEARREVVDLACSSAEQCW